MKNQDERLQILSLYIEQLVLCREVELPENAEGFNAIASLFGLNSGTLNMYIDDRFTHQALKILADFGLLSNDEKNNLYSSMFWIENTLQDLNLGTVGDARVAHQKHYALTHDKKCSICLENNRGHWFKSSTWCDHSICKRCCLERLSSAPEDSDLLCHEQGCNFITPPSLYLALSIEQNVRDEEFRQLSKDYHSRIMYHQKHSQSVKYTIPNMRICHSCRLDFICCPKKPLPRTVICPRCKVLQIIAVDQGQMDLTQIVHGGQWGYCGNCKGIVNKIEGCDHIQCGICKTYATFIPM